MSTYKNSIFLNNGQYNQPIYRHFYPVWGGGGEYNSAKLKQVVLTKSVKHVCPIYLIKIYGTLSA